MNIIKENYPNFSIVSEEYNTKAYVACGKLSATNFVVDTLWDYIPGQYIVQQAGGVIYNDTKMHIVANGEEFLQIMKNNSSVNTGKIVHNCQNI